MILSAPEVPGLADASNCIVSLSQGKYPLAHASIGFMKCVYKMLYLSLLHTKIKILFDNNTLLWWAIEPWYVLMVEVPLQLGKKDRINNECRLAILAPYKPRNHEIYNGSGEVSCTFFLSHTDGLTSKGCPDRSIYMVKGRT